MGADTNLKKLGLALPPLPSPMANYVAFRTAGDMLYLAGQGPRRPEGGWHTGKVGKDVTLNQAYDHAKIAGLALLAVAKAAAGSLDNVEVIKVLGMVNAVPGFTEHPAVINGCSDLFVNVLGAAGKHARSAVGMGSLPQNITVEIECIMRIRKPIKPAPKAKMK